MSQIKFLDSERSFDTSTNTKTFDYVVARTAEKFLSSIKASSKDDVKGKLVNMELKNGMLYATTTSVVNGENHVYNMKIELNKIDEPTLAALKVLDESNSAVNVNWDVLVAEESAAEQSTDQTNENVGAGTTTRSLGRVANAPTQFLQNIEDTIAKGGVINSIEANGISLIVKSTITQTDSAPVGYTDFIELKLLDDATINKLKDYGNKYNLDVNWDDVGTKVAAEKGDVSGSTGSVEETQPGSDLSIPSDWPVTDNDSRINWLAKVPTFAPADSGITQTSAVTTLPNTVVLDGSSIGQVQQNETAAVDTLPTSDGIVELTTAPPEQNTVTVPANFGRSTQ